MRRNIRGFSFLELAVCLAILGVLAAVAMPGMASLVVDTRYTTASHELTGALALARTRAVVRGTRVSVCPLGEDNQCGGPDDWSFGWMVFDDTLGLGTPQDELSILSTHQRPDGDVQLQIRSTQGRRLVRYAADGRAGGTNLTLSFCDASAESLLGQVVVSGTGRARGARAEKGSTPCPFRP